MIAQINYHDIHIQWGMESIWLLDETFYFSWKEMC